MAKAKKPTARNAQLTRILGILRDLDRLGGVDIYELADRYGTTTRTIRRDLNALHSSGLPLEEKLDGNRKRWQVAYKHTLDKVSKMLDAGHYMALRLAVSQGGAVRSATTAFATLEDLAGKIEAAIGPGGRDQLAAIDKCFYSYEKHSYVDAPPDILWPLIDAIIGENICSLVYRAPKDQGEAKTFKVRPLRIFTHQGATYVMGYAVRHANFITLNLQRIQSLTATDELVPTPANFNPAILENAAFGVYSSGAAATYVLDFTRDIAPYIKERTWHSSQTLTDTPTGVRLTFTCAASFEVLAWVASWRDKVCVVSPDSLRKELASFGAWCCTTYSDDGL